MKKITLFLFALFACWQINAQVAYTHGWEPTGLGSWTTAGTGTFDRNTTTPCAGSASARANVFYNGTNTFTSPLLGTSNGGLITFGFDYKVTLYSSNTTGAPAAQVQIDVQWSSSTTGPWNTLETISSSNHVVSSSCASKSYTFVAPVGSVYVRFLSKAVGASSDLYYYYDNISVSQGAAPSCFSPASMSASSITASSAAITWPAVTPTPGVGYEYYYSTSNVAPTGAGTATTALTENLSGLTSNTLYYVWLRSDCGGGDYSAWFGPYSFRTLCDAFSIPFTETFDSTSSTEACWTVLNVNADADAWNLNYATTPITGDQSAMIYTDGGNGTNDDWLITPKITLNGNQRLLFKYKVQSSTEPNDFRIMLSTTGKAPADFTTTLMPLTAFSNTTAETRVISLSGISGDVYIGYHVPAGGLDGWRLYIDDVTVEDIPVVAPTCSTITFPSNGALNVPNTRVNWSSSLDATGYRISVGYGSGTTEVLNSFDVGNVLSYTFPYEAATTYYVTVYPYNAFGVATGCSEISFTTCDISTDFVQNFESTTGTNFPDCWAKVGNSGTAYTQANTGISGARNLYMYSSSTTSRPVVAIQSVNNANAGTHRMRMKVRGNFTAGETIEFGYLVNPSDATTFTSISSIVTNSTTTAQDFVIVPLGMPAGNVVFALRTGTATYSVLIDDVAWEPIPAVVPTCVAITSPTDQAINVTNSRVTWSTSLDATGYKISVGYSSGATDVLNMFDVGNVTSYVVPTDPGTTYFVTVYPYNSFGTATGCSEISFTTCDALFPDVTETFATFLPSCWLNMTGGDLVTGPTSTTGSGWVADGFANNGTTGAVRNEIWTTGANDWLISPLVTIPASGYELRFDAAATQYATSNAPTTAWEADDFIQVLVSTGFSNWTVLYTYDNTNQPGITATSNIINLDAYAGMDVRFAFRAVEGTANGNADIDFFIDNFNVRLTPASAPSCATNIVATPNATCGNFATVITWDAAVSADGYNIAIGTTPGTGNVFSGNLGNVLTYSFIGNIGTTYYYTIVPYNAFGSATGCTEQSFITVTTGCYCVPTYTNGGANDIITNVVIGSWSNSSTGNDAPYYVDFTSQQPTPIAVPTMTAGLSSTVSLTFGSDSTQFSRIWIDFNNNFTFEPSESFAPTASAGSSGTSNIVVNVPSNAVLGNVRMRIRGGDDSAILATQACGASSSSFGQTEDYLVNILPAPSCLPPTALNATAVTSSSASLGWTEAGTASSWDIEWGTLGFTPTGTPTISGATNPQPISGLNSNTTYSFYVRANCGAGGFSTWSGPFSFTTACVAENVPYSQDFETATVPNLPSCTSQQNVGSGNLWTVQNNPGYGFTTKALRYSWNGSNAANVWFYTNGINLTAGTTYRVSYSYGGTALFPEKLKVAYGTAPLASAMTTVLADYPNVVNDTPNNVFVDFTPTASGVYYFGFNAYSIANQFYLFVDNIVVDVALSNTDFDNSNFIAYPNPVKDVLNVSYSTEISSIRVINMIGQEVISRNVNASSTQVDMSELSAGTYIVNVTLGDAVKTLKVVKQ